MQGASTQGGVCLSVSSPLCQGGAQTAGPGAYFLLAPPLHVYFSSLNILETVELWLDAQPAVRKCKPLVAPPNPRKL